MSVLDMDYRFSSLSLRDLLDARDAYHFHLLHKPNVIGTALGLYLIRSEELWPSDAGKAPKLNFPRTLFNSEVRDYSWPCVLVFVREWEDEASFGAGRKYSATDMVPKTLYLADGRAVPVCIVKAPDVPADAAPIRTQRLPVGKFGGGLPIEVTVQGKNHVATVGALVSDGHTTYALTARHACGPAGTVIEARGREGLHQIGVSSGRQLTRQPFTDIYPGFAGRQSYVALDVGLVEIDDIGDWTSNTYGLPPLGAMADLSTQNLSLRLIDQPLVASGAASGLLRGTIKALFYRYSSVGGYDYIADYLIAPAGETQTRHGDSGMVWHLDVTPDRPRAAPEPLERRELRPLAMEWGGQVFTDGNPKASFALATSLANICRLLDVELLTDVDRGVSGYWGRTGHYGIASLAVSAVTDGKLRALLENNLELISFDASDIAQKDFDDSIGDLAAANQFVPLADVPDEIWKQLPFGKRAREGGRDELVKQADGRNRIDGPEHPNHYADMDMPIGTGGAPLFRDYFLGDASRMTPDEWLKAYEGAARFFDDRGKPGDRDLAKGFREPLKQGLLPFRLWQFFDAMVACLKAPDVDVAGFIAAAGIASHYMGDASQPLHGSIYADGDATRTFNLVNTRTGAIKEVRYGKGVHSAYETSMVSFKARDLLPMVEERILAAPRLPLAADGRGVAMSVLGVMSRCSSTLDPMLIVEAFVAAGGRANQTTSRALWDQFGGKTADVMTEGALGLAMLWESAWKAAGEPATSRVPIAEVSRDAVRSRYIDKTFVPSLTLKEIGRVLQGL